MESLFYKISQVLGITIIHSLWQGLIVYILLRVTLILFILCSSATKCLFALIAMLAITGWFYYTLVNEISIYHWLAVQPDKLGNMPLMLEIPVGITHLNLEATRYYYDIERYLPFITAAYAAGFLYYSAKLLLARSAINQIKNNIRSNDALQTQVSKFAVVLSIAKEIRVGLSQRIDVPCVTGFFKPLILLPVNIATTLSVEEIEMILLHELAHIKRNDYLVNLAQQTISVMLFFNPFLHLVNNLINREREISCDNVVIQLSQKPLVYANALLKLEQTRRQQWQLTLAASGNQFHLLNRIERIMETKKTIDPRQAIITLTLFIAGVTALAAFNPTIANGKISVKNVKPVLEKALGAVAPQQEAVIKVDTTSRKQKDKADTSVLPPGFDTDTAHTNSSGYQVFGFDDQYMDQLYAEYKEHSNFVNDYYKSDTYQTLIANLHGPKAAEFFNNDTLKNIMLNLYQVTDHIKVEYGENGKNAAIYNKRQALGKAVGDYYRSEDFSRLNKQLQTKYNVAPGRDYFDGSPNINYQNYQAELNTKIPAVIKVQILTLKDLSEKLEAMFASADFRNSGNQLHVFLDSLKKYNNRQHIVQYKDTTGDSYASKLSHEDYKKYSDQLHAYTNSPQINEERKLLKESSDKMWTYANSAEYRQREQQWKNQLHMVLNENYDRIAHAEQHKSN